MAATSTFRNVRHALRKRGIDLDRFLPFGGLAAGVLAGLLAWGVLSGWFLDYRAEVDLRAGPGDRAADATQALVDRAGMRAFQDEWFDAARAKDGLCSHGRLEAFPLEPAEEGDPPMVRLVCRGRPRGSVRLALDRARDLLTDPRNSGISPLPPRNHAQRLADAVRRVAEAEKRDAQADAQEKALQEARAKAAERKTAAQAAVDAVQKRLADTDERVLTARRRNLVEERAKLTSPSDGPVPPTEAEQLKLRGEYARLEGLLREDSRRDSTADHPVVRRMTDIARRLKLAEMDREIAEIDRKLDRIKPLTAEEDKARALLEAATRDDAQAEKNLTDGSNRRAQTRRELTQRETERKNLDADPRTPVEAAAVSAISDVVERDWLFWGCLGGGLAAGLLSMVVIRLRIEARHSQINSSSGLARCLHVPVLGVVPDLGSVAPQQE